MTSKNINPDDIKREIENIGKRIIELVNLHDSLTVGANHEEISNWFEHMSIETLDDSLRLDLGLPRNKKTLADINFKFSLRKEHEKLRDELVVKKSQLTICIIDDLLCQIERLQNEI